MNSGFSDDFTDDHDIDLTPLIDAVFMLIIFFVMTAGVVRSGMNIDIPAAVNSTPINTDLKIVTIAVDASGKTFSDGRQMTADEIRPVLEAKPGYTVNLQVDRKAPFETFAGIMDVLRGLGKTDVSISTLDGKQGQPAGRPD